MISDRLSGKLYGTAESGGAQGFGTVFAIDPATGAESTLASLTAASGEYPDAELNRIGSALWTTASAGGSSGAGTVFRVDPATGVLTTVYNFAGGSDGATPYGGLLNVGGTVYGTTYAGGTSGQGTVFAINAKKSTENVLHSFAGGTGDGALPNGALISAGGLLYGTAAVGGTGGAGMVFSVDPAAGTEASVHGFSGSDGCAPSGSLRSTGGVFYGTTSGCGPKGFGTVFSLNPASGSLATLYGFSGGADGGLSSSTLAYADGVLFGTALGTGTAGYGGAVFSLNLKTGIETTLHSFLGSSPIGPAVSAPLDVGGALYGTTENGGASHAGTIYKVDASGTGSTLYTFLGGDDGAAPSGGLIKLGNLLYGVTASGGAGQSGTVFAFDPATGKETALYVFMGGNDGASPHGPLLNVKGVFYGTTSGGASGVGTVFALNPKTGALTTVYAFTGGTDGAVPEAPLIAYGGLLYGTTAFGGAGFFGNVFSVDRKRGLRRLCMVFREARGVPIRRRVWPSPAARCMAQPPMAAPAHVSARDAAWFSRSICPAWRKPRCIISRAAWMGLFLPPAC